MNDILRKNNRCFEEFKRQVRAFPTCEWIRYVSRYDNHPAERVDTPNRHRLATSIQRFQRIAIVHYALRCTNNHRIPRRRFSQNEYIKTVGLYMESEKKFHEVINQSRTKNQIYHALAPMAYEQFKNRQHPIHTTARCSILYRKYEQQVIESIGIDLDDLMGVSNMVGALSFKLGRGFKFNELIKYNDSSYHIDKIIKIFDLFCTNPRDYKTKCKAEGVGDSPRRHEFKLIEKYPIVETSPDEYHIPILILLLNAASANVFHIILNSYSSQERPSFFVDFGNTFEGYVRKLFEESGYALNNCDDIEDIAGKEGEKRAEFYVEYNNEIVVIECKRFSFKRDTLINKDPENAEREINRVFPKAIQQIKGTSKYSLSR